MRRIHSASSPADLTHGFWPSIRPAGRERRRAGKSGRGLKSLCPRRRPEQIVFPANIHKSGRARAFSFGQSPSPSAGHPACLPLLLPQASRAGRPPTWPRPRPQVFVLGHKTAPPHDIRAGVAKSRPWPAGNGPTGQVSGFCSRAHLLACERPFCADTAAPEAGGAEQMSCVRQLIRPARCKASRG